MNPKSRGCGKTRLIPLALILLAPLNTLGALPPKVAEGKLTTSGRHLPATEITKPGWAMDLGGAIPHLAEEPIYADSNNITGKPLIGKNARPYADAGLAKALASAAEALAKKGYGVTIHDAYRPHKVTLKLWNAARELGLPDNTYACPYQASDHNRGAAVDISLYRLDGHAGPERPSPIGEKEPNEISEEAKNHKDLLRQTMRAAGFDGHPSEWWHFSYPPARVNMPGDWKP